MRRRTLLTGTAAVPAIATLAACVRSETSETAETSSLAEVAATAGLVFGSSAASWQLDDADYAALHHREAAALLTEDDLLWYRLRPRPQAQLDFTAADEVLAHAGRAGQYAVGAHLLWDGGLGPGWDGVDLPDLGRVAARRLLLDTIAAEVTHCRGRVGAWVVANEVTDAEDRDEHGLRTSTPWYRALGPDHVADAFHTARGHDPDALLVLNEFGFETEDPGGQRAEPRRNAFLEALDHLLDVGAPIGAVGLQAHLNAEGFATAFDGRGYAAFLSELADRGVRILVTELDVLDSDLPADADRRDRGVADVYARYLDVTLDQPAVVAVLTFGLTDRYSWLQEQQPRTDGGRPRPLLYDEELRPKPAHDAVVAALSAAPHRSPLR